MSSKEPLDLEVLFKSGQRLIRELIEQAEPNSFLTSLKKRVEPEPEPEENMGWTWNALVCHLGDAELHPATSETPVLLNKMDTDELLMTHRYAHKIYGNLPHGPRDGDWSKVHSSDKDEEEYPPKNTWYTKVFEWAESLPDEEHYSLQLSGEEIKLLTMGAWEIAHMQIPENMMEQVLARRERQTRMGTDLAEERKIPILEELSTNFADPGLNTINPGDYVQLQVPVVEVDPTREEIVVELFSKTDQYTARVRFNHVTGIHHTKPPLCRSLNDSRDGHIVRCERVENHEDRHAAEDLTWQTHQEYGRVYLNDEV